jgi:hypothetical protein
MTSTETRHTAQLVKLPSPLTGYSWQVTWLPGQHLTRDQAITAMTIAETVATTDLAVEFNHRSPEGSKVWGHIDNWASELGITGPHAVAEASLSPEDFTDDDDEHPNARDDLRQGRENETGEGNGG